MSEKELKQFDELKANVTLFVAPIKNIVVTDFKSSQDAITAAKVVKDFLSKVDRTRKELVGPLNDRVKFVNAYAKTIEAPLLEAEAHIKRHLAAFEVEQESIRSEAIRKAEEARREQERLAAAEAQRIAEESEAKRLDQLNTLLNAETETGSIFGSEVGHEVIEAECEKIEAEIARARLEEESRMDREQALREMEHKQRVWDIERNGIKGARKNWKCEAVDLNQVPKEFLIVTLNTAAVLAAARAGVKEIAGVRIWQETIVPIGRNTYVPDEASG